jgi:hypothetical protein
MTQETWRLLPDSRLYRFGHSDDKVDFETSIGEIICRSRSAKICAKMSSRVAKWFIFLNQKSQFGYILEGRRLENVDIFYGHFEYFTDIREILRWFGAFCDHLVPFGIMYQEKSGNPAVLCGRFLIDLLQVGKPTYVCMCPNRRRCIFQSKSFLKVLQTICFLSLFRFLGRKYPFRRP